MKILQLGKFHPVRGGVEKVMYDLMTGLSERGVDCDMLCALSRGGPRTIPVNAHARLIGCRTWMKVAATMISPGMILFWNEPDACMDDELRRLARTPRRSPT